MSTVCHRAARVYVHVVKQYYCKRYIRVSGLTLHDVGEAMHKF